jgi:hypothetical protein
MIVVTLHLEAQAEAETPQSVVAVALPRVAAVVAPRSEVDQLAVMVALHQVVVARTSKGAELVLLPAAETMAPLPVVQAR